jgi:hypothetical protein
MKHLYQFQAGLYGDFVDVMKTPEGGSVVRHMTSSSGSSIPVSVIATDPESAEKQALESLPADPEDSVYKWRVSLQSISPVPAGF